MPTAAAAASPTAAAPTPPRTTITTPTPTTSRGCFFPRYCSRRRARHTAREVGEEGGDVGGHARRGKAFRAPQLRAMKSQQRALELLGAVGG